MDVQRIDTAQRRLKILTADKIDALYGRPTFTPDVRVWPKNSCSFTLVVFEEASNPFTTSNRAGTFRVLADGRKEQHVALALVISLVMIMVHILVEHMAQGAFAE